MSIDLPPAVCEKLRQQQVPGVYWIKWMDVKNFHVTINFLGDLGPGKIEEAKEVLRAVTANFSRFPLTISGFDGKQDMLWAIFERSEVLQDLHDQLKEEFRSRRLMKSERRGFTPHVLIAKSKTGRKMTWRPEHFSPVNFEADRVCLYESELTPGAATHRIIESFPLQ